MTPPTGTGAPATGPHDPTRPHSAVAAVAAMLEGGPGILLPRARTGTLRTFGPAAYDDAGTGRPAPSLVLFTSGSTGTPKGVALSRDALLASARATEDMLHGPGRWHLCLPVNHIAGLQVVLRALLAGAPPTLASTAPSGGPAFDPRRFAEDLSGTLAAAGDEPVYTSLVPTQLSRVLRVPASAAVLARASAVLLGGASISPRLLERAADAGVPIVRTYGMSETAGGCVYDGLPFPDVDVRLAADRRIVLAGPVLADGYVHVSEAAVGGLPEDASAEAPASEAASPGASPVDAPAGAVPVTLTALAHPSAPAGGLTDSVLAGAAAGGLAGGFHGEGASRALVTSDLGRWDASATEEGLGAGTSRPHSRSGPHSTGGLRSTGNAGSTGGAGTRPRIEVLGRADDVIVTGGENVSPHEVETALLPVVEPLGYAEVLVTARDDEEWGAVLVALLVPEHPRAGHAGAGHAGAPTADGAADCAADAADAAAGDAAATDALLDALRAGLRARGITGPRVPRHVRVVDALPRKSIGKPDRAAARLLGDAAPAAGG